ncbi:hypothetical protein [Cohnella yongneupensis]|uniref:Glycosyl transferase family 2 n=1 Tax=Cohnella yongneupensis TaxID=425006 RepID=A0ABW0QUM7_9BACL
MNVRKHGEVVRYKRSNLQPSSDFRGSYAQGLRDGELWLQSRQAESIGFEDARAAVHRLWSNRYYSETALKRIEWKRLINLGERYGAGFLQRCADTKPIMPVPLRNTAAAIVCIRHPSGALFRALAELDALPLQEIIVVVYGVQTQPLLTEFVPPRSSVIYLSDVTDPDIGRALGAKLAVAKILLFVDGNKPVSASVLARFLWECDRGADIALNDLSMKKIWFHERGGIQKLQEFLNASLNRPDLKSNSLTALPYALSRKALDTIGAATLCVPAKAHAVAILSKLRIVTGGTVAGSARTPAGESVSRLIAGDHAEAWHTAIAIKGSRLTRPDLYRNREVLGDMDR